MKSNNNIFTYKFSFVRVVAAEREKCTEILSWIRAFGVNNGHKTSLATDLQCTYTESSHAFPDRPGQPEEDYI